MNAFARIPRKVLVGAALVGLILLAVAAASAVGARRTPDVSAPPASPVVASTAGPGQSPLHLSPAPSTAAPDDGDEPSIPAPPDPGAPAREAASAFAASWLNTTGKSPEQWRASLAGKTTKEMQATLADADPASVPTGRVGEPVTVAPVSDGLVEAKVPVVSSANQSLGTLTLLLYGPRFLVGSIDWSPV